MKQSRVVNSIAGLGLMVTSAGTALAGWPGDSAKCKEDAVKVGPVCMDKYEASVWEVPATSPSGASNRGLKKRIQDGKAKYADLIAGGAVQRGVSGDNYPCANNGSDCKDKIYAVSLSDLTVPVRPSRFITWFQAQAACANARKRLPSNVEWQLGVQGTPDPGPDNGSTHCNTTAGTTVGSGSRSNCVSSWGAYDMVGNLWEWVEDWVTKSSGCTAWASSNDALCLSGASTTGEPGALIRGGYFDNGSEAGPLAVNAFNDPFAPFGRIGFRCAR